MFMKATPRKAISVAALLVLSVPFTTHSQSAPDMSAAARSYLTRALDILEHNSINKKTLDWAVLRSETMSHAAGAQTTADTYEAIRFALRQLGDHHSFLQLSSPALIADDKEARERRHDATQVSSAEKWPPSPYIDRHEPGGSLTTVDGITVATIVVPSVNSSSDGAVHVYAVTLQQTIAKLADLKPDGWIVDLRGNLGGECGR